MMYLKIHKKGVVSLCDEELVGKKFTEGDVTLDVNKRFYHSGKTASKEEIVDAMKEAETMNIVGEESVELAVEIGVLVRDTVKHVAGIPYAQVFTL